MKYRAEIDGLRAIAVLSVVVFHFYPNTLDAGFRGYLGVDIFFVISGFLIGSFIIEELENASFSFAEFYWRRVKRILPAALVTLIFASIIAIFVMTPYDLTAYFESQLAALTFTPNIYFWRAGGYFGDLDALKPLLHYWSLGVEEQFYLFFPVTLLLIHKVFGPKSLVYAILMIAGISFLLNILLIEIGGNNPAFFLLPTRIWQFGLGCLAACLARKRNYSASSLLLNVMLTLLFLSFFIEPPSALPDGLLVTIFTAMILVLRPSNGLALSVLANKTSLFIGRISFSLYLLHWPVVVFLTYIFVNGVPQHLVFTGLIFTIGAAYLSYRFVEAPFRYEISDGSIKKALSVLIFALGTLSVIGIYTDMLQVRNSQLVSNLSAQVQTNYRCPVDSYRRFGGSRACVLSGAYEPSETTIVLVGNSHAQMYAPLIRQKAEDKNSLLVPLNSCLPTLNVNINPSCLTQAKANFEVINGLPNLKFLVVGTTWYSDTYYSVDGVTTRSEMLNDLLNLIDLYEKKGVTVFIVSPIPIPKFQHASDYSRLIKFNQMSEKQYIEKSKLKFEDFVSEFGGINKELEARLGRRYIQAYENLCDEKFCYFGDLGGAYFADNNHISKYGLSVVEESFDYVEFDTK